MSQSPVAVGDVLADKYRVEEVIGVGGMGVVVGARHIQLDTHVALKFMLTEHLDNDEAVSRFLREAKAAAKLRGEHVARVTDVGKLSTGAPYMVMEYLRGEDLNELSKKGRPPLKEACLYVFQACDALEEAHAAGIVHRDVKPANLFLTKTPKGEPCVKVLDFGISKVASSGGPSANLQVTKTTAVFGSPLYMSPEQMRSSRDVDARSDVWSLGATLYELLTGTVPFVGETVIDLCLRVTQDPVVPPSSVVDTIPKELDAIVVRCLEKDPKQRYPNVRELAVALAPFAGERTPSVPQAIITIARDAKDTSEPPTAGASTDPSWGKTTPPKSAKSRVVWIGGALAALAVIAIVAFTMRSSHDDVTTVSSAPSVTSIAPATATATIATATATITAEVSASAAPVVIAATASAKPKPTTPAASTAKPASSKPTTAATADPYSNPN